MQLDFFRDVVDLAGAQPTPDIVVVGAGVRVPGQFTHESVEALRRCQTIYGLLSIVGGAALLRSLGPRVEDLSHLYQAGRLRPEIYDLVATTVLEAAARQRPIGYVTSGNPVVFDSMTHGILAGATERGLHVRIFPGVSSIDTVLVNLRHEIAGSGIQIYGASWFVARGIEPRLDVPCLLLQPGVFGTGYSTLGHEPLPGLLSPLRDHLLHFYPPEHEVVFVESSQRWYEQDQVQRVALKDLGSYRMRAMDGSTLFIPRLREPAVTDPAFLARMSDRDHFAEAFRPAAPRASQVD